MSLTERKASERLRLFELFDSESRPADIPYTFCFRRRLSCDIIEESFCYRKCVIRKRFCDSVLVSTSFSRLLSQRRELDKKKEIVNNKLLALSSRILEL